MFYLLTCFQEDRMICECKSHTGNGKYLAEHKIKLKGYGKTANHLKQLNAKQIIGLHLKKCIS